jgi:hypothetical protein
VFCGILIAKYVFSEGDMQSTTSQSAQTGTTATLLKGIYQNAKMGSEALLALLPKVADSGLRRDLTAQLDGYEGYAKRAEEYLCQQGKEAQGASLWQKMTTKVGIGVNTLMDSDTSHIAELVIEGSNMNITDYVKLLREHENCQVNEKSLRLCRDMIEFEQENVKRMQAYL